MATQTNYHVDFTTKGEPAFKAHSTEPTVISDLVNGYIHARENRVIRGDERGAINQVIADLYADCVPDGMPLAVDLTTEWRIVLWVRTN